MVKQIVSYVEIRQQLIQVSPGLGTHQIMLNHMLENDKDVISC